jgi:hypothetical protein
MLHRSVVSLTGVPLLEFEVDNWSDPWWAYLVVLRPLTSVCLEQVSDDVSRFYTQISYRLIGSHISDITMGFLVAWFGVGQRPAWERHLPPCSGIPVRSP